MKDKIYLYPLKYYNRVRCVFVLLPITFSLKYYDVYRIAVYERKSLKVLQTFFFLLNRLAFISTL